MGSVHEVMAAFREAPSNSEHGTKFEKLMVRYFDFDPLLSQQYDARPARTSMTSRPSFTTRR
ncbi:MAG: hypothetical protein WBO08_18230 [Mycobacterium sp.]|nr:hypothetical protein [Mycobacterium sp.]